MTRCLQHRCDSRSARCDPAGERNLPWHTILHDFTCYIDKELYCLNHMNHLCDIISKLCIAIYPRLWCISTNITHNY
jgi:hypothetical protein